MKKEFIRLNEKVGLILVIMEEMVNNQTPEPKPLEWLSKNEVMDYLRISESTYYNWKNRGILKPSSTIGEDRYLIMDVNKIFNEREYRQRFKFTPSDNISQL